MSDGFGEIRTIPASDLAKSKMKKLVSMGLFKKQGDAWRLGAALGIVTGNTKESGDKSTFENINSLDPDGFFSAIMFGLYPDISQDERLKKLVDYAEWGIDEVYHRADIGTLDFSEFARMGEIDRSSLRRVE